MLQVLQVLQRLSIPRFTRKVDVTPELETSFMQVLQVLQNYNDDSIDKGYAEFEYPCYYKINWRNHD